MLKTTRKEQPIEQVRLLIQSKALSITETDEAEALLDALSYQSQDLPHRHVWVEADEQGITIDLEDRNLTGEWDNTVAHVHTYSAEEAVVVIRAWLLGERLPDMFVNGYHADALTQKQIEV